jgi:glycine/D-amino acid oxidase-like deaminating enzyme
MAASPPALQPAPAPVEAPAQGEVAFHAEWVAALQRMEVDVDLAEAMLAADHEVVELAPWSPPVMRSPLPGDLEPRARLVLERQLAVTHRMAERLMENGRHRRFTQAVRGTFHVDIPVYVDMQA